mmetsp:Transcript_41956/g.98427  ORF Transcript_41956/g.98427 Transcript_41956/m.98427 type:complete len:293 (+) Transcript_41956:931-1809(+)
MCLTSSGSSLCHIASSCDNCSAATFSPSSDTVSSKTALRAFSLESWSWREERSSDETAASGAPRPAFARSPRAPEEEEDAWRRSGEEEEAAARRLDGRRARSMGVSGSPSMRSTMSVPERSWQEMPSMAITTSPTCTAELRAAGPSGAMSVMTQPCVRRASMEVAETEIPTPPAPELPVCWRTSRTVTAFSIASSGIVGVGVARAWREAAALDSVAMVRASTSSSLSSASSESSENRSSSAMSAVTCWRSCASVPRWRTMLVSARVVSSALSFADAAAAASCSASCTARLSL